VYQSLCRLLLSICLLSIFISPVRADDLFIEQVTFNTPQPPGAVIIRYGGLRGLFVDELESQLTNYWNDSINLYGAYRSIWDEREPYETLGFFMTDYRKGGRWWERAWYYSRPPEKGGAPHPRVYNLDHVAVDLWLFQIDSKMKIKAKEFSFLLHSERRFSSTGPADYWKVRIKPSMTLGPPYGVRRAGCAVVFEWYLNRVKTWEIQTYIHYRAPLDFRAGAEISLVRW
jgi:hypothetical protein